MTSLQLYLRTVRYVFPHIPWIVLATVLSVVVVGFDGLSLWFSASVVKTLFLTDTEPFKTGIGGLESLNNQLKMWTYHLIERERPVETLRLVCMLMAGCFFFKNVFTYLKTLVIKLLNLFIVQDLRNSLFRHALLLPVAFFDRQKSSAVPTLVANDANKINTALTETFNKLFTEPARILLYVVLLIVISPKLSLFILLLFPTSGYLIRRIGQAVRRKSRQVNEKVESLLSIVYETITGIRVVKMFNMFGAENRRFEAENRKFFRFSMWAEVYAALSSPLVETLGVFIAVTLIWYAGGQVLETKSFTAEDFLRYVVLLFAMYKPLKTLGETNNRLQEGIASAQRIFALIDTPVEPIEPYAPERVPEFRTSLAFDGVGFTYPGTQATVLSQVSFEVKKGQVAAVIGPSGGGKSTLLELLPRLYDVTQGAIRIDGRDIRELDLTGLRSLFGVVAQETVLFNDTVRANIAYGLSDCPDGRLIDAAKRANAWEFIQNLPQGLDTVIGENGTLLSGGQRQRLSIARAILKNPAVLILDEATSSLDTESERLIQNAINNLMENRTTLVVAHRLSTIMHADVILVLEGGRIIERGTHEELLRQNGRYKYYFDIQFKSLSA